MMGRLKTSPPLTCSQPPFMIFWRILTILCNWLYPTCTCTNTDAFSAQCITILGISKRTLCTMYHNALKFSCIYCLLDNAHYTVCGVGTEVERLTVTHQILDRWGVIKYRCVGPWMRFTDHGHGDRAADNQKWSKNTHTTVNTLVPIESFGLLVFHNFM